MAGGLLRGFLEWAVGELADLGIIEEAAESGYDTAMSMCGNEGQVSVIDMTGFEAFVEAAEAAADERNGLDVLISACPYPDAVSIILEESYSVIEDIVGGGLEALLGGEDDGEGEEFEESGEDFDW